MNTTPTTASAISRVLKSMNYERRWGIEDTGFSVHADKYGVIITHRGYDHGQPSEPLVYELEAKGYLATQDAAWTDTRNGDKQRVQIVRVYGKLVA